MFRSIFRNWYHQKMIFFQILFDYQISFSLLIKKQPFIIFLPKKQRIYDYFYEFASEALNIVIFENFIKSMTPCLSKLKVTPSFCFAFKIPDDVTTTNKYVQKVFQLARGSSFRNDLLQNPYFNLSSC